MPPRLMDRGICPHQVGGDVSPRTQPDGEQQAHGHSAQMGEVVHSGHVAEADADDDFDD